MIEILSLETCLKSLYSRNMFQGSTYTPQIGNTDCEFVIQFVSSVDSDGDEDGLSSFWVREAYDGYQDGRLYSNGIRWRLWRVCESRCVVERIGRLGVAHPCE